MPVPATTSLGARPGTFLGLEPDTRPAREEGAEPTCAQTGALKISRCVAAVALAGFAVGEGREIPSGAACASTRQEAAAPAPFAPRGWHRFSLLDQLVPDSLGR